MNSSQDSRQKAEIGIEVRPAALPDTGEFVATIQGVSAGMVKSLRRGLDVLLALADADAPLTTTVIAERMGRNRIQVSRVLQSLEAADLVTRDSRTRAYRLSWSLRTQATGVARARLFVDGPPTLRETVAATGESAFLAEVRGDGSVAILENVPTGQSWVGRSYPLYCDDAGQSLLLDCGREELEVVFAATEFVPYGPNAPTGIDDFEARLRVSRERGYSIVDSESEPGVFAVAAPVRDFSGQIICALHIQGPTSRLAPHADEHGAVIRKLADRLSGRLGWRR